MEELVIVLDQETGERNEMSKVAFESLICYDDKGRYLILKKN
ncbi:hypothetical protein [Mangrovibacterium lignilyticum]|nr:hypothetical protein [Mangrovibacterium lignilyticum]